MIPAFKRIRVADEDPVVLDEMSRDIEPVPEQSIAEVPEEVEREPVRVIIVITITF